MNLIAKRAAGSVELFARNHGPAILTAAGIGGFIATTYLTGRAVLKAQEPAKELKLKLNDIKDADQEDVKAAYPEIGKDAVRVAMIFAPAVLTGSASIICLVASHKIMRNQQASLVAAYTLLDQGFRAYRERVKAEIGQEKELELYQGPRYAEMPADYEGPPCLEDRIPAPYAIFFDESNQNWNKNPEYNKMFLHSQQNYANDRLQAYGFLFLNEVLEMLGFARTQSGQIVGWRLDGPNSDGYVDFGMYNMYDDNARAFVNGHERSILLDFNVDGPITIP